MEDDPPKKWWFCWRQDRRRPPLDGWIAIGHFDSEKQASEARRQKQLEPDGEVGNVFIATSEEAHRRCASGATG